MDQCYNPLLFLSQFLENKSVVRSLPGWEYLIEVLRAHDLSGHFFAILVELHLELETHLSLLWWVAWDDHAGV